MSFLIAFTSRCQRATWCFSHAVARAHNNAVYYERTEGVEGYRHGQKSVTTFVVDEVTNIVKESIENNIGSSSYVHTKVPQWTSTIVEQILNQLTKLGKPFKYIVTCVIMQKCGAGLHTASSCYWDNSTDGSCTVKWENKSMYFIVTVFGLAI